MTTPTDVLRGAIFATLNNVHTCLPAEIISYDYTQQKASVQPLLKKNYKDGTVVSLPIIESVPVVFPKGGAFQMHWPLKAGDGVVLIFSERSLDNWLSTGGEVKPVDPRKFDLSDAIAIPGLIPFTGTTLAEDNINFTLKLGDSKVVIAPDGKVCFEGVTEELMTVLNDLITQLSILSVTPTPSVGVPLNPTVKTAIDLIQTRFGTLKGTC